MIKYHILKVSTIQATLRTLFLQNTSGWQLLTLRLSEIFRGIEGEHKEEMDYSNDTSPKLTRIVTSSTLKAVARRCFSKQLFLKMSQILQENTCVGVSFLIKLQMLQTSTQVYSCEICEIFKKTFFTEHFRWLLLAIDVWQISRREQMPNSTSIVIRNKP